MSDDKKLGDRVRIPARATQSSGDLYDRFLSSDDRGIFKWHHYFDIYERHLARFRGSPVRILEIGVKNGGSLSLWSEYFGEAATIVGLDIQPRSMVHDGMRPNVSVRIGDQADPQFLRKVEEEFGPFEVVIDDGGHSARQQINSFNFLYPRMTAHGIYICEDTHTSYWPRYADAGPGVTMIEHTKKLVDHLHEPYFDEGKSMQRFSIGPEQRSGDLLATRFAAETFSVQFYDSIVVFERRPRSEPYREQR